MSLFFNGLPMDLQIEVLHTWINVKGCEWELLKALSAMDIACCSKRHRLSFRSLARQLPPIGGSHHSPKYSLKRLIGYMSWVHNRTVRVKSLLLKGRLTASDFRKAGRSLSLPSVEYISWVGPFAIPNEVNEAVLQLCPNATSLDCADFGGFSASAMDCAPKLTAVSMSSSKYYHCGSLRAVGPRLRKLRMVAFGRVAKSVQEFCPLLQKLECEVPIGLSRPTVFQQLLEHCTQLVELKLHNLDRSCSLDPRCFKELVAFRQLQRLSVHQPEWENRVDDIAVFADLLELRPDLMLQIGNCKHFPLDGILHVVSGSYLEGNTLSRILNCCAAVSELVVSGVGPPFTEVGPILRDRIAGKLTTLTIVSFTSKTLVIALQGCGSLLMRLNLDGCIVTDALLQLVALNCQHLEDFSAKRPPLHVCDNRCWCDGSDCQLSTEDIDFGNGGADHDEVAPINFSPQALLETASFAGGELS